MSRLKLRHAVAAVASAALFAVTAGPVAAQQPLSKTLEPIRLKVELRPGQQPRLGEMKSGEVPLSPPSAADKEVLAGMAQYFLGRVTHAEMYVPPEGSTLKPKPADYSIAKIQADLRTYLLKPTASPPLAVAQEGFVREFAAALDKQLTDILAACKTRDTAVVRVNAGILLAEACTTGAPAHWPTVIALLKDKTTPPEVVYYALKAADALLAAYDPARLGWVKKATALDLVQTLDGLILAGFPAVADKAAGDDSPTKAVLATDPKAPPRPTAYTRSQVLVIRQYRLVAVRALGRLKADELRDGDAVARPLVTLARVAAGDPAIVPPPSDKETAEAVVGLLTATPGPNLNSGAAADAAAVGIARAFRAKADSPKDASAHWKVLAAQVDDGLTRWKAGAGKLKDPDGKAAVSSLADLVKGSVTAPIVQQKDDAPPQGLALNKVDDWLRDRLPARANGADLFADAPSKVAFPK